MTMPHFVEDYKRSTVKVGIVYCALLIIFSLRRLLFVEFRVLLVAAQKEKKDLSYGSSTQAQ